MLKISEDDFVKKLLSLCLLCQRPLLNIQFTNILNNFEDYYKKISNEQELEYSDVILCPQNKRGKRSMSLVLNNWALNSRDPNPM